MFKVELCVPHHPWEARYSRRASEARDAHVSALPFGPHEPDPPHVPLGNHSHMSWIPQTPMRLLICKWGLQGGICRYMKSVLGK